MALAIAKKRAVCSMPPVVDLGRPAVQCHAMRLSQSLSLPHAPRLWRTGCLGALPRRQTATNAGARVQGACPLCSFGRKAGFYGEGAQRLRVSFLFSAVPAVRRARGGAGRRALSPDAREPSFDGSFLPLRSQPTPSSRRTVRDRKKFRVNFPTFTKLALFL